MSLLTHQSAINPQKDFWLKAGGDVVFNKLTANSISTTNLSASNITTQGFQTKTITIDEATISSISTNAIELDGAYLTTVGGTEILLNGVPLATTANLSSIADWAIYPAVSSITTASGANDIGTFLNPFRGGFFSTIYAQTAFIASTTTTLTETLSSQFVNVVTASTIIVDVLDAEDANISTLNGVTGNFQTLNVSTLNAQNAPTFIISTITGENATFSSINVENAFISSISTNWLRVVPFDEGNENGGIFAGRAVINNLSTNSIRNTFEVRTGTLTATNATIANTVTASTLNVRAIETVSTLRANRGDVSTIFNTTLNSSNIFTINANGRNATFSTVTAVAYNGLPSNVQSSNWSLYPAQTSVDFSNFNINNAGDVDCLDIDAADITCCNVTVGGLSGLADVEIYGSTALPGDSALYVEGGVEFQGGTIHGFSAGALPVLGVNTQRFSLTPLGISVFSPTFISLNSGATANIATGGAFSLAVGGVANLAAGTYFEIDSGYMKFINNCPIILSANSGTGAPGGLEINTYTQSNSLQLDGLSFGCQEKISGQNSLRYVSSGSANQFLETIPLPAIGQWYVKASYQIIKLSGGGNQTDAFIYMAPTPNPPLSAFNQVIFGAPIYSFPSSQTLTINGPVVISTIAGFTSTIGSTITENFSTFLSTGQTFSTFTSTFFSTIQADGGLNIYFDGIQSQNAFTASLQRGTFLASYLGGYIPPV